MCTGKVLIFTCTLPRNLNMELIWRINFASLSVRDITASFVTGVDNVGSERAIQSSYGDLIQFTLVSKNPVTSSASVNSSNHLDGAVVECSGILSIRAGPSDRNQSYVYIPSGKL